MRWSLVVFVPVFVPVLALPACIPLDSQGVPKRNPDFRVVGHRGAPNVQAENTIPSYDAAMALGASALELDLNITSDGVVVVWHDRDPDDGVALARQEGLEGLLYRPVVPPKGSPLHRPIDELSLADFMASHGYARSGSSERDPTVEIPTLERFLAWAVAQPKLRAFYLDIKVIRPEQATQILDQVAAAGLGEKVVYAMSVREEIVRTMIARQAPGVRVVWDHEHSGALKESEALGLRDLSLGLTALRSESEVLDEIDEAREARKQKRIDSITTWTLDADMQMEVFLYHEVDAILTDDPARLLQIWQATL